MPKKEYDPAVATRIPKDQHKILIRQSEFYKIRISDLLRNIIAKYCQAFPK